MKKFILSHKGLLFLGLLLGLIFITNYRPGTYLLGWDSLSTELNPVLGIKRALFSSWQEYQSFGLVAGMAHAADLVRAVVIFLLSLVLPESMVRYTFTMGMVSAGAVGVFMLMSTLFRESGAKFLPFTGALFYLLNFNIIQMFFLPFEAFSVFAAVLPWNILLFIKTLENGLTKRNLALFILLSILSTPAFVAQQLFVVFTLILGCITAGMFANKPSKRILVRALIVLGVIVTLNLFWILPQIYFLLDNGSITKTSKISQLSTVDIFFRNLDKGNIWNFLSNTGFFYESNGLNQQPLFSVWKSYREFPLIQFFIYIVAFISILGIFKKTPYRIPFLLCLAVIVVALLNNTSPIRELNDLLRSNSFVNQMFRNPFTKFSIPYALVASYFFCAGLLLLSEKLKKIHMHFAVIGLSIFFIFMQGFPALFGQYISSEMKVNIPSEYNELFTYFESVPENKRIALLPDYTYWGWYYQEWGYNGSGFLWYGIKQPIVSRNFDMWSAKSESYFWEAKDALESEDVTAYNNVLQKYDIDYIVLDESASPVISSMKAIQYDRLKTLLETDSSLKLEKKWGNISVYKVKSTKPTDDFVSYTTTLPNVGPAIQGTSRDSAYATLSEYQTDSSKPFDVYYPFLDFMTQTQLPDKSWEIHESDGSFRIVKKLDFDSSNYAISTTSGEFEANLYFNNEPVSYSLPYSITHTKDSVSVQFPKALLHELTPKDSNVTYCWAQTGKITTKKSANSLTVTAKDGATACLAYDLDTIDQRYGYMVSINSQNKEGQELFFYIVDQTKNQPYVEDRLKSGNQYYVVGNRYQEGVGYSFAFQANSLRTIPSVNTINRLAIFIIPYEQIKNIAFTKNGYTQKEVQSYTGKSQKLNYYTYATLPPSSTKADTLILSQAFDAGWNAYSVSSVNIFTKHFPFILGDKISKHVTINNWENGWILPQKRTDNIVIMFIPQYLEYGGLLISGAFVVSVLSFISVKKLKSRTSHSHS